MKKPLTDDAGEVRALTKEDFAHFSTVENVLPAELAAILPDSPKRGRPLAVSPKKAVNIRLSQDVLTAFKSDGRGWQTRIDDALREWLKRNADAR